MKHHFITATNRMLAAGLLGLASAATAATGASAQAVPTEWFKICTPQGENEICNTQYTLIANTRQLITAVNLIEIKGAVNQRVLQAVVPTGRVIPAGIQFQIDANQPQTLNYSVCFPDRCIAEVSLTDEIVANMKRGNELTITSVNVQRQPNPVKITLSGFTAAFDGPPQDQSALAQRQQQLNEALQQQAEQRRQRFEAAQEQAVSGGGAAPAAPAQ